jgi:hypothetical protein
MRLFLPIFVMLFPLVVKAQADMPPFPDSLKARCEQILIHELGREVTDSCVSFKSYTHRQVPVTVNNQPSGTRHIYEATWEFTFPGVVGAKLELGFNVFVYNQQVVIQSARFLRPNQSDLPPGFAQKGLQIIGRNMALGIARHTDEFLNRHANMVMESLVTEQNRIVWIFEYGYTTGNPQGDAELYISHAVWIDPYTGDVLFHRNGN